MVSSEKFTARNTVLGLIVALSALATGCSSSPRSDGDIDGLLGEDLPSISDAALTDEIPADGVVTDEAASTDLGTGDVGAVDSLSDVEFGGPDSDPSLANEDAGTFGDTTSAYDDMSTSDSAYGETSPLSIPAAEPVAESETESYSEPVAAFAAPEPEPVKEAPKSKAEKKKKDRKVSKVESAPKAAPVISEPKHEEFAQAPVIEEPAPVVPSETWSQPVVPADNTAEMAPDMAEAPVIEEPAPAADPFAQDPAMSENQDTAGLAGTAEVFGDEQGGTDWIKYGLGGGALLLIGAAGFMHMRQRRRF